jgi:cytochrome c-type biogenesis protein CcsB
MSIYQTLSFWALVAAYVAATFVVFAGIAWRRPSWMERGARVAVFVGGPIHAVALGVRWYEAGHFPYVGNYEGALFGAGMAILAFAVLLRLRPETAIGSAVVLPVIIVTLGWGLTHMDAVGPVTPVYQSPWLITHFTFSWTTYAVYLVVAGLAVANLIRIRAEERGRELTGALAAIPSSVRIDEISLPLVGFGFLNNALLLVTGSIWANRLWGQYWGWDPVETWSLLTWLGYGFYLHARLTLGWTGKRLAWIAVIALFGISMATWGVQFAPTSYHLFRDLGATMFQSRPQ